MLKAGITSTAGHLGMKTLPEIWNYEIFLRETYFYEPPTQLEK